MKGFNRTVFAALVLLVAARVSPAQNTHNPAKLFDTPAVSGYEQELSKELARELNLFSPKTDNVGNVVRAVDNSNTTPREYVDRVVAMAREHSIPVQYGVTGGGNDGSVFVRYGSVDGPMGWPLRYAHSPGEVIDTKDVDVVGKIVETIARQW
jgi:putative aminopeptidase